MLLNEVELRIHSLFESADSRLVLIYWWHHRYLRLLCFLLTSLLCSDFLYDFSVLRCIVTFNEEGASRFGCVLLVRQSNSKRLSPPFDSRFILSDRSCRPDPTIFPCESREVGSIDEDRVDASMCLRIT